MARKYEFYALLPGEHKIHIFELTCNVHANTNSLEKAGNGVIDMFTCKDIQNSPLRSPMQFRMNFMSGLFSSKTPVAI